MDHSQKKNFFFLLGVINIRNNLFWYTFCRTVIFEWRDKRKK